MHSDAISANEIAKGFRGMPPTVIAESEGGDVFRKPSCNPCIGNDHGTGCFNQCGDVRN
jgi:hypothetical protein